MDDYLRLIQLRASNAWLKKYWDVSLKLQAKENYDHLVASSDQIPMIPTYKNNKIDFKYSYVSNFLKLQKKQSKMSFLHKFVNESGRAGANTYLCNASDDPARFHRHNPRDGWIAGKTTHDVDLHLRKAYKFTYTIRMHRTFYDHFIVYRDRIAHQFFPTKSAIIGFNIREHFAESTAQTLIKFFRNQDHLANLFKLQEKYFDGIPFYDFIEYEKNYRKYPWVEHRVQKPGPIIDNRVETIFVSEGFYKPWRMFRVWPRFNELQERIGDLKVQFVSFIK